MSLAESPQALYTQHSVRMGEPSESGVFELDSAESQGSASARGASVTSGGSPPSLETANADIELSRRAVPVVQIEEDVCSICLDCYTEEDPANCTVCGHLYHLQCIMQWAQRSRECPMCFKALVLKDESLNELLPFGEYIPPEQLASPPAFMMGLDAWELDRLLTRLALHNTGGRRSRTARHRHGAASSRQRRSSGGEADAREDGEDGADGVEASAQNGGQGDVSTSEHSHPSSWPPASERQRHFSEMGSPTSHPRSPSSPSGTARPHATLDFKAASDSLRSRWAAASLKAKESLTKATKEVRARWTKTQSGTYNGEPSSSHASTAAAHLG